MRKRYFQFILIFIFICLGIVYFSSCTKSAINAQGFTNDENAKGRYLYVVTRYAKIHKEATAFSEVLAFVKMKSRVKPIGLSGSWVRVQTMKKNIEGYIHRDSIMPLRKIKRFLKQKEFRDHLKMESGGNVKGFSEEEEIAAGTKGFSEEEDIAAAIKGFSEEESVSTGSKGFSSGNSEDGKITYRYDLLDQVIKGGKILNPYEKLSDFRRKRSIGEYYKSNSRRIQKWRQKRYKKRKFNMTQLKHHDGFLPHEEYELGKHTSAYLLSRYKLYKPNNKQIMKYLDNLVETLAMASFRPEVFNGYRVMLVESPKINALSTPGGFILLTTGLIKKARKEDDLAAVLAHEVSHIALRHPTKSISQGYRAEMLKHFAEKAHKKRKAVLEKRIDKMHDRMKIGYGQKMEYEADLNAVDLLMQLGYEPNSLTYMIRTVSETDDVHGDPKERAGNIQKFIKLKKRLFGKINTIPEERTRLFLEFKKSID